MLRDFFVRRSGDTHRKASPLGGHSAVRMIPDGACRFGFSEDVEESCDSETRVGHSLPDSFCKSGRRPSTRRGMNRIRPPEKPGSSAFPGLPQVGLLAQCRAGDEPTPGFGVRVGTMLLLTFHQARARARSRGRRTMIAGTPCGQSMTAATPTTGTHSGLGCMHYIEMPMTPSGRFFRFAALALAILQLMVSVGAPVLEAATAGNHHSLIMSVGSPDSGDRVPFHDSSTCIACQAINSFAQPSQPQRVLLPRRDVLIPPGPATDVIPRQTSRQGFLSRAPPGLAG
jgi:hypothetical protein